MKYRTLIWIALALLWPPTIMAATLTFGDSMRSISLASFVGWALLSTLSGITALFYRIDRELKRTGTKLPNPGVFVVAHMSGSWTAGLLAFLSGEGLGAPGLGTAVSIILFSFGGATALEKIVERRLQITLNPPPDPKGAP